MNLWTRRRTGAFVDGLFKLPTLSASGGTLLMSSGLRRSVAAARAKPPLHAKGNRPCR
jgi:hypothetical protein